MKVRVKSPFYDNNGLHMIDDIVDVNYYDSNVMEKVEDKKAEKAEIKAEPKKAPAKKKG